MNIFTFQDPASEFAQALIQLHHYIFFILIVIFGVVTWLLVRIMYFFSYKSKKSYNTNSMVLASNYYSLLNNIFVIVFIRSGLFSTLFTIDSKVRELGNSLYNTLMQASLVSEISTMFSKNSLISNDFYIQKAIMNFSNSFYTYLSVSKVLYLDNVTGFQFIGNTSELFFVSLFDKFLSDISWDINSLISQDTLNTKLRSNFSMENLVSEDLLLNGEFATILFNVNNSFNNISLNLFGNVAGLIFKSYYNLSYKNPELVNDSKSYYYSFSNLYKFYSVDIYRTSFLFFENVRHSTKLEIVWTIVPTLVLVLIAMPSFALLYSYDEPLSSPSVTIKAVGHQWYWSYEYTDYATGSIAFDSYMIDEAELNLGELRLLETDNRIVLPVGVAVRVLVTSGDVLHSWAVPSFAVKVDAVPGRLNQVILLITRPGVFYGQCSELCGVNHGFMPIVVEAVTIENFFSWVSVNLS